MLRVVKRMVDLLIDYYRFSVGPHEALDRPLILCTTLQSFPNIGFRHRLRAAWTGLR